MKNVKKYVMIKHSQIIFNIRKRWTLMKEGIHPNYNQTTITCACGNVLEVGSTKTNLKVDVCSKCHPYWTGNLRQETVGGRADKFKKKYGLA